MNRKLTREEELCERGCQDKRIKMYAANYIKKVQSEREVTK